jgi:hypothetical protein
MPGPYMIVNNWDVPNSIPITANRTWDDLLDALSSCKKTPTCDAVVYDGEKYMLRTVNGQTPGPSTYMTSYYINLDEGIKAFPMTDVESISNFENSEYLSYTYNYNYFDLYYEYIIGIIIIIIFFFILSHYNNS